MQLYKWPLALWDTARPSSREGGYEFQLQWRSSKKSSVTILTINWRLRVKRNPGWRGTLEPCVNSMQAHRERSVAAYLSLCKLHALCFRIVYQYQFLDPSRLRILIINPNQSEKATLHPSSQLFWSHYESPTCLETPLYKQKQLSLTTRLLCSLETFLSLLLEETHPARVKVPPPLLQRFETCNVISIIAIEQPA